jgi:hypothetical protein
MTGDGTYSAAGVEVDGNNVVATDVGLELVWGVGRSREQARNSRGTATKVEYDNFCFIIVFLVFKLDYSS